MFQKMKTRTLIFVIAALCLIPVPGLAALPSPDSDRSENSVMTAVELMELEQYDAAADTLRSVIATDPDNDAALFYLGILAIRVQKPLAAEAYLQKAASLDSANFWYRYRLAQYHIIVGRKMQAIAEYEGLVKDFPKKPEIKEELLEIYLDSGYLDEALSTLNEISGRIGPDIQCDLIKGEIYRMKDFGGLFIPFFRDTLYQSKDLSYESKGKILLNALTSTPEYVYSSQLQSLCDMFDTCVRNGFENENSLQVAIYLNYKLGRHENFMYFSKVLAGMEEASQQARSNALLGMADMEAAGGNRKTAYKYYDTLLSQDPDNMTALNNYAYFLATDGKKLKKAYDMSARTISAEPDNMTALDTFGWILHLMKRDVEAKAFFKRALAAGGTKSAVICDHYADVLFRLGEYDTAFYYYRQAVKKDTSSELKDMEAKIEAREQERKARESGKKK